MKEFSATLDKASGYFFLFGFAMAKLKNIPNFLLSSILNFVSLVAYLIGYLAWFLASLFYPDHPRLRHSWYGFLQFKQQFQLSALLGMAATILCLISPIFLVPAAWIYSISNLVWAVGEYHKKENPRPDDQQYSSEKQALYFRYTVLVTATATLMALASTIALICPPVAFSVITCSTIIGIGLTIAAFSYWGRCTFGNFTPDVIKHSYGKLSHQLSFSLAHTPKPSYDGVPKPTIAAKKQIVTHHQVRPDLCEREENSATPLTC